VKNAIHTLLKYAASRPPVDFGGGLVADLIDGAKNNGFGRPVNIQLAGLPPELSAKLSGVRDACTAYGTKIALAVPNLSPKARHLFELAGLGLIAAPVAHDIIARGEDESPALTKAKHLSDLTGLGVLAAPSVMDLLRH